MALDFTSSAATATTVTRLANGVRAIAHTVPSAGSVSLGIWIGHGSGHEAAHESGYTHLWEHLWFRAREGRCVRDIERLGGQINAYTTRTFCALHARVLPQYANAVLALMAEMITACDFTDGDVARERDAVLAEIAATRSPETVIEDAAMHFAWGDHSWARPVTGNRDMLAAVRARDLRALCERALVGANVCVVAVGAVGATELSVPPLARLPMGRPASRPTPAFHAGAYTKRGDVARSRLLWLLPLPTASAANDAAGAVAHHIVTGGTDSRLYRALRGAKALAYDIHSRLEPGAWIIRMSCEPDLERECRIAVDGALDTWAAAGPTPEEIAAARAALHTKLTAEQEDPDATVARLARDLLTDGRTTALADRLNAIDAALAVAPAIARSAPPRLRLIWSP